MTLNEELFSLKDNEYKEFHKKLIPTVDENTIIGIRVPKLHELTKRVKNTKEANVFLEKLPHHYYDENMLHGFLIAEIKDYDTCIAKINEFLPFVDNWAVCDSISPKVFKKHRSQLIEEIFCWVKSDKPYTVRFGIKMLMDHFLDEDFKEEYLEIPAGIKSDEYYINMMIAWFYATAFAKQWDASFKYITEHRLEAWTNNKAIQKACESRRISDEQKVTLRKYRI